jgi:hypothetical protein
MGAFFIALVVVSISVSIFSLHGIWMDGFGFEGESNGGWTNMKKEGLPHHLF